MLRPIPDTANKYHIDEDGQVYSDARSKKTPLRTAPISGYPSVTVYWADGRRSSVGVHRLMALVFMSLPLGGRMLVPNHIDGDKTNNSLSNLEVVTASQNARHAVEMGLTVPPRTCKLTSCDVDAIRQRLRTGAVAARLADEYGVSRSLITLIRQHKIWNDDALNKESN